MTKKTENRKLINSEVSFRDDVFNALFESSAVGMAVVSPEGDWLKVNSALLNLIGCSLEECFDSKVFDLLHENDREIEKEYIERLLSGKAKTYHAEKRYIHKSGHIVWVLADVLLIRTADNKPLYFIYQLQDISEEKNFQEELFKNKQRLDLALSVGKIGSWDWNIETDKLVWDKSMFELHGLSPDDFDLSHDSFLEIVHEDDRDMLLKEEKEVISGNGDLDTQFRINLESGKTRMIRSRAKLFFDADGKPKRLFGVSWDATKESNIDRTKSEFVSLASHQLRTPLSTIGWFAEILLKRDNAGLSQKQLDYVEEIFNANKSMVELVNSLLNVSKLELGNVDIYLEEVNIPKLINEIIEDLSLQISEKDINISVSTDAKVQKLLADKNFLKIAIQNLVNNAVKYTPSHGEVSIDVNTHKEGHVVGDTKMSEDSVEFSVSDTGYGIPEEDKKNIFKKFFRSKNVREFHAEGTGLGLYIVKSIADYTGGKVMFTSKEGKGTTFSIIFPLSGMKENGGGFDPEKASLNE